MVEALRLLQHARELYRSDRRAAGIESRCLRLAELVPFPDLVDPIAEVVTAQEKATPRDINRATQ